MRRRSSNGSPTRSVADRLVWGSDYPQTHDRTYAELVALGRERLRRLAALIAPPCSASNALRLWPALMH